MSKAVIIGDAHGRHGRRRFAMNEQDRLQHLYIIGQTGTGKSTLIDNLARQDAANGTGFCLIDPHGDLAGTLAERLRDDCLYWDVANPACTFGYNPLTYVAAPYRPLIASCLIDMLKKQWADAWGARMEHLLRYAVLALLDQPSADLRDILPMYFDKDHRARIVAGIEDEQVRQFWSVEYKALRYQNAVDGVAPIANKLGAFLAHPVVRRAVCEPTEPIRFRKLMDDRQHLIINLSAGRLGADTANVLGGMALSGLAHAGLSRATLPPEKRRSFMVYADEFQAFTSLTTAGMLPQLRKYGVGLTLAHQYLDQLDRPLQAAIFGNAGSTLIFRIGASDAPVLASQLGEPAAIDLMNLANFECFARIMQAGQRSKCFSAYTRQAAA